MDLLSFLVLETSYYSKDQFKAFRSLEAYNQLVSGFVSLVKGHKMGNKYIVLGKVRHSQRMNDPCVMLWIITEESGTVLFAHFVGCMTGQDECCSHIASVLFYIETWNHVNEKLSCTQVKCSWLMPTPVKEVPYAPVSDIDFRSAKKLKQNLDQTINYLTIRARAFRVGNLKTAISSYLWQRVLYKIMRTQKMQGAPFGGKFLCVRNVAKLPKKL